MQGRSKSILSLDLWRPNQAHLSLHNGQQLYTLLAKRFWKKILQIPRF
jgi:hypothetical protein